MVAVAYGFNPRVSPAEKMDRCAFLALNYLELKSLP
jgi:hypothetical protein